MKKTQEGISLFIVMIIVLLSAILVAMSFRSSVFNEYVVGNTSEYQRVYEAAQALISDAELDIQGIKADGTRCTGSGCREFGVINAGAGKAYFPESEEDYADVAAAIEGTTEKCIQGICMPLGESTAFWSNPTTLANLKPVAATYGQFTGASAVTAGNTRLQNGWYWIEMLRISESSKYTSATARRFKPSEKRPQVYYRITAIAQGNRNTRAVIQKVISLAGV